MSEETQKVDSENKMAETQPEPAKAVVKKSRPKPKRKSPIQRRVHGPGRSPLLEVKRDETPPDPKADQRSTSQMIKDGVNSVNKVLIPDESGDVEMKFPVMRDPEAKQMIYETRRYRWVDVPNDEVLYYTQSTIIDFHSDHTASIVVGNRRTAVVFDRSYAYNGRIYQRCAWIPDKIIRAGVLFEKKIDRITRLPKAVLKKIPGTSTEAYQIVGKAEQDYRDLKRIFERVFIKKGVPANVEEDKALLQFMHDSVPPDEMEVG